MRGCGVFEDADDFRFWQDFEIIERKHQRLKNAKGRKGRDVSGGGHGEKPLINCVFGKADGQTVAESELSVLI